MDGGGRVGGGGDFGFLGGGGGGGIGVDGAAVERGRTGARRGDWGGRLLRAQRGVATVRRDGT